MIPHKRGEGYFGEKCDNCGCQRDIDRRPFGDDATQLLPTGRSCGDTLGQTGLGSDAHNKDKN
ncbi:hypothetical protein GCM10009104_21580 [Marinobacterium maritimum]|uniref:Uncharacterized protein n=1 Tax=Marinobacterium maritimum TaxID=500162 RepID=A0ABN1I743_9GAMM